MPFYPPFNYPFYFNNNNKNSRNLCSPHYIYNYVNSNKQTSNSIHNEAKKEKSQYEEKASETAEASETFFEIFGLKLYFDDILIMCILFFLYNEKVHDDELFICLILLLLTWL